jgi:hypothetical protein
VEPRAKICARGLGNNWEGACGESGGFDAGCLLGFVPHSSVLLPRMAGIGAERKLMLEIACFRFCPHTGPKPAVNQLAWVEG